MTGNQIRCRICDSPDRADIDAALIMGRFLSAVASQWRLPYDVVKLHRKEHMAEAIQQAKESGDLALLMTVEDRVNGIHEQTLQILRQAEGAGKHNLALQAIGEARRNLELIARLRGDLGPSSVVNVAIVESPQWQALRGRIVAALRPHPLALRDVLAAIGEGKET